VAFGCGVCHPSVADVLAPNHIGTKKSADVAFSGLAVQGVSTAPTWNRASPSCANTYCHGTTLSGGVNNAPLWTGGAAEATCGSCHGAPPPFPHPAASSDPSGCAGCHPGTVAADGTIIPGGQHVDGVVQHARGHDPSWMDSTSTNFHAYSANAGLSPCQGCHGPTLAGTSTVRSCASCHDGTAAAAWGCTMCHGGTQNQTGAPPKATWGNTAPSDATNVRIGAHTAHVTGSAIAGPIACAECHITPADPFAATHIDGPTASVIFGTLAAKGGPATWDRATATCASTYCHGAFQNGNASNAPVWTQGPSQGACGTCHGTPPGGTHPSVSSDLTKCSGCHKDTMTSAGALIPASQGGKHLDGIIDTNGHDTGWMDPASSGFHAFSANAGLASCTACHGPALEGNGSIPACASCHQNGGSGAPWGCTMCHGGTNDQSGAPPKATWGNTSPADPTNVRIGAHAVHVSGSDMAPAFDCVACHVKPADALSPGHVDAATATVAFGGIWGKGTGAWNRGTAACSNVYCHGAFQNGNASNAPIWTQGQSQGACGTCHGTPPGGTHPVVSSDLKTCVSCHDQTMSATGALIPPSQGGKHLDGVVQGGHATSWMDQNSPGFHAYSANEGLAACATCHGPTLDGTATVPGCGSCHDQNPSHPLPPGVTSWKQDCTMCHGGTDDGSGAPPRTTWGNNSPNDPTNVRIGAHASHVSGAHGLSLPIACTACHSVPADALAAGHVDAVVSVTGYTGSDPTWKAVAAGAPGWNATTLTCSTTYCHGGIAGGTLTDGKLTAPKWTQVDGTQAACGTCHGSPPVSSWGHGYPPAHNNNACTFCHYDVADDRGTTITNPAAHINGVVDVRVRETDPDCAACHAAY
jgi:predicted CxxxxCH...CXXCH cytochrome family protein